eukprot:scaffold105500_cov60-Phaeocystis_antarctica.AAC.2
MVSPWSSNSSVLALACSRAFTHAICPLSAPSIRPVAPSLACRSGLAECCRTRSRMERWPPLAAPMSAVWPRLIGRSTLAPRFSSSLTISSWLPCVAACSRPAAEVRPSSPVVEQSASISPPLPNHLATFRSSPRCADRKVSRSSEAGELTVGSPASGGAAGGAAAGGDGAACCRISCAVAMWPSVSAHCRAVSPWSSSSSVLALARSRAFTHAICPWLAARIRAVPPPKDCRSGLAECCSRKSRMER